MAEQIETPKEKVWRHWYQGKLGARLLRVAQMAKNQQLLRRGARKMQDGTFGESTQSPGSEVDEDMQIRIGDESHYHTYPAEPKAQAAAGAVKSGMSTWSKLATSLAVTALASSLLPGIGIPLAAWLGAFDKPPQAEPVVFSDSDTFPGVVIKRPEDGTQVD